MRNNNREIRQLYGDKSGYRELKVCVLVLSLASKLHERNPPHLPNCPSQKETNLVQDENNFTYIQLNPLSTTSRLLSAFPQLAGLIVLHYLVQNQRFIF
jgi:hypothetical protein